MTQLPMAGVVPAPDDEKSYEKLIVARARELGWIDWKVNKTPVKRNGRTIWLTATNRAGWQDRTFIHPLGWFLALEVKGKRGEVKPAQREHMQNLQRIMDEIDSPRFKAFIAYPKDWPVVERLLARPLAQGARPTMPPDPSTDEGAPS